MTTPPLRLLEHADGAPRDPASSYVHREPTTAHPQTPRECLTPPPTPGKPAKPPGGRKRKPRRIISYDRDTSPEHLAIVDALLASPYDGRADRASKMDDCPGNPRFRLDPLLGVYYLIGIYCHHRFCRLCAEKKAWAFINKYAHAFTHDDPPRHFVGTFLSMCLPYADQLDFIYECDRNFRRSAFFKTYIRGTARALHFTVNEATGLLHWHFHYACVGHFMPLAQAKAAWAKATKGSYIIHISRPLAPAQTKRELLSYIARPSDIAKLKPHEICELDQALKGRRVLEATGCVRAQAKPLEKRQVSPLVNQREIPLPLIEHHARQGDPYMRNAVYLIGEQFPSLRARFQDHRLFAYPVDLPGITAAEIRCACRDPPDRDFLRDDAGKFINAGNRLLAGVLLAILKRMERGIYARDPLPLECTA